MLVLFINNFLLRAKYIISHLHTFEIVPISTSLLQLIMNNSYLNLLSISMNVKPSNITTYHAHSRVLIVYTLYMLIKYTRRAKKLSWNVWRRTGLQLFGRVHQEKLLFSGTYQTRGFSSKVAVVWILNADTDEILDF